MAAFSPRSPSPVLARSTSGFRSTDSRGVTRRAQNASSGIKTDSPSEFHQRSSVLRERSVSPSPRASFEHKEDDRDENRHCPKLVRSGSLPSFSKGTKNFMAPTISAASKATASPRKKILSERNANDHNASPYSSTSSPQIPEPETFSRTTNEDPRSVVNVKKYSEPEDPKILARASPNDASQPPYDPYVNFLSPRPEFIRYSPNPRLERYRREENCTKAAIKKQLESSFASESSLTAEELKNCGSEIGLTSGLEGDDPNEETHSSESGVTTGFEANGDNEKKGPSEVEASSELESPRRSLPSHEEKPEKENEQAIESSSPESGAKNMVQENVAEVGASKTSSSKFYLKSKLINVAVVIAIASLCLTTIDSPLLFEPLIYHGNASRPCLLSLVEQNVYQDMLSIADIDARNCYPEIKQVENIKAEPVQTEDVLVRTLIPDHQLSASNVAYSISSIDFPQPEVIMTTLKEPPVSELEVDGEMEHSNKVPLPQEELIPVVESAEPAAEVDTSLPETTIALDPFMESATPLCSSEKSEMQVPFAEDIDPTTFPTLPKEKEEVVIEEPSAAIIQVKNLTSLGKTLGIQVALGILLVALTIIAVTYWKTNNNREEYVKMKADNVQDNIGQQHSVSEVEMTGESCSAEMSSTTSEKTMHMHYPGRIGKKTEEVVQKYERRRRRGSSVSSSEVSLSYGSFTTYEKLPIKQGSADEGAVTPIRRSSRVKKQVISS